MVFYALESERIHGYTLLAMSTPPPTEFNPLAGLAAAVFPGAGHLVLGRRKRAFFAAVGVMGLFFFGLLIGGIDAIDSKNDKIWFYAQALVGPSTFIVDNIHQNQFKAYDIGTGQLRTGYPDEQRVHEDSRYIWVPIEIVSGAEQLKPGARRPNTPGLGRINEIAMLSIVLAGMLNLIIFLDALMPGPERTKPKNTPKNKGETQVTESNPAAVGGNS